MIRGSNIQENAMAEIGFARAVVVDNTDPKGAGRIGVRFPWHSRPDELHWASLVAPMAGDRRGIWFRPEVGDEVVVAFEHGDLRLPYLVGGVWNAAAPPPSTDEGRDLRMIRTRSGHTLVFDDGADGGVELTLKDGKRLSIGDRTVSLGDERGNGLTIHADSGDVTIHAAGTFRIRAAQISIEGQGPVEVRSSSALALRGSVVRIN
jgi:uncharacterized protein involved in type VI secretion and phage assembly